MLKRIEIPADSLVLLLAPSGAGKSTFARRHFRETEIVSSDRCRARVSDDEADQAATRPAFEVFEAMERDGPERARLFWSGPVIDGEKSVLGEFALRVGTSEDAEAAVDTLAARGVDVVKLYEQIPLEAYRAAAARACAAADYRLAVALVRRVSELGGRIGAGTDTPAGLLVLPGGGLHRELELLVEGDPSEDIRATRGIRHVIKAGRILSPDGLRAHARTVAAVD